MKVWVTDMTYKQMKRKVLALIEELNEDSTLLTDDPDVAAKIDGVMNQIMAELARMKKIPQYVEIEVEAGQMVTFSDIGNASGYEVYQIDMISGVSYVERAAGTAIKFLESGTAEISIFTYPEEITENNRDAYTFELSNDALEIMPYGVAADLLKSDVSAEYGNVYANRYEQAISRLDSRYRMTSIYIDGGVDI